MPLASRPSPRSTLGTRRRPAHAAAALSAAALALGACDSPTAPDAAAPSRSVAATAVVADTGYTHYAADVTVQVSRPGWAGRGGRTRTFSYHIDRVRQAGGTWTSTTQGTPSDARLSDARFSDARHSESRVAEARAFAPRGVVTPVAYHGFGRGGVRDGVRGLDATLPDEPLATPATVAAVRTALGQGYRLATTAGDGTRHYTRAAGNATVDVAVDPKVGHVQEVKATRAGTVVLQRTYTFTRLANGLYARTSVRTQQLRPGGTTPMVTTTTYTHLVFDRAGGQ